ncbi:Protein of unknown function [Gryllus bimaculatus]|nr:Protein of unknown function [Gryllus bimaculatus]
MEIPRGAAGREEAWRLAFARRAGGGSRVAETHAEDWLICIARQEQRDWQMGRIAAGIENKESTVNRDRMFPLRESCAVFRLGNM